MARPERSILSEIASRSTDHIFGLPRFIVVGLFVFLASLAVLAYFAKGAPSVILVIAVSGVAIGFSVLVYVLGGKNSVDSPYGLGEMKERGAGEANQMAFTEMLAGSYDPKATTIYVITSGYSERGFDDDAKIRMSAMMNRLDKCLQAGVSVVRFVVLPDSLPLARDYVDWVCRQLDRHDRDGKPVRGDIKTLDARCLLNLPSMALICNSDGTGVVRHVIESMEPRPGGPPGELIRIAELAWEVRYDHRLIAALKRRLDAIALREKPLTTETFRERFGTPSHAPA